MSRAARHDAGLESLSALASRVEELEAVAGGLRHEGDVGTRHLRRLMARLALSEERAGNAILGRAFRVFAAAPANTSFDAALALLLQGASGTSDVGARSPLLGAREREVLKFIAAGLRTPCIAERMGIRAGTVGVHRRNIMRKLGLHSVADLTRHALREGLIGQ